LSAVLLVYAESDKGVLRPYQEVFIVSEVPFSVKKKPFARIPWNRKEKTLWRNLSVFLCIFTNVKFDENGG